MASPAKRPFARGFAADRRTERALRAGLAGRDVQIQRGRLTAALRTLAVEPASRLVFVDLDGIEEPEAAARQLTGICAFDTALVAIGSVDTAHYGRSLLQLGISDYLVKPVTAAAIRDAVAALTDDMPEQLYAGEVIAFAGSPGSGTSTLVAAVARGIVADGRVVSVVDLDPMSGKLPPPAERRTPGGAVFSPCPSPSHRGRGDGTGTRSGSTGRDRDPGRDGDFAGRLLLVRTPDGAPRPRRRCPPCSSVLPTARMSYSWPGSPIRRHS